MDMPISKLFRLLLRCISQLFIYKVTVVPVLQVTKPCTPVTVFWGECDKAKCCIEKGFEHCGQCPEMPCDKLKLLFGDPEHGDRGARLRNLQNWNNGNFVYEKLGNAAQEKAKEL